LEPEYRREREKYWYRYRVEGERKKKYSIPTTSDQPEASNNLVDTGLL
jgi:hypothetical protein